MIDRYRNDDVKTSYLLGYVRDISYQWPEGKINPWADDLLDDEGNILVYGITNFIEDHEVTNIQFSMNWGSSGKYSDIYYTPYENWDYLGVSFNKRTLINQRSDIF